MAATGESCQPAADRGRLLFSADRLLSYDIFWLKEDGHIDPDSLPPLEEVARDRRKP